MSDLWNIFGELLPLISQVVEKVVVDPVGGPKEA
jgi:hypothetical protein